MCDEGSVRLSLDDQDPLSYDLVADELARGRVEVCAASGGYREVCRDDWSYDTASVVCLQLGFSPYGTLENQSRDVHTY